MPTLTLSQLAMALARCDMYRPRVVEVIRHEGVSKGDRGKRVATGMYDVLIPPMGALGYITGTLNQEFVQQAMSAIAEVHESAHAQRRQSIVAGLKSQLALASSAKDYEDFAKAAQDIENTVECNARLRDDGYGMTWIDAACPQLRCVSADYADAKAIACEIADNWNATLSDHRGVCALMLRKEVTEALERIAKSA